MPASHRFLHDFIRIQDGTVAPEATLAESQTIPLQISRPELGQALESIEPVSLIYDPKTDASTSRLNYFEDGKQNTLLVGHILYESFHIPVHFATVAAVIMYRDGREMRVWKAPLIKKALIIPKQYITKPEAFDVLPKDIEIVDINAESPDYYKIKRQAVTESKKLRLQCEEELIAAWLKEERKEDDLLVIDGTIMNFRNEDAIEHCVGLSKSFQNIYCSLEEYQKVLQLQEFQRSWAFRFKEEDEDVRMGARDRISWYLRLRNTDGHGPEFGMLRIEVSLRHKDKIQQLADEVSRSVISERYPASFPDARWHNLIYPIKRCEDYLRSVMPSPTSIRASLGSYQ